METQKYLDPLAQPTPIFSFFDLYISKPSKLIYSNNHTCEAFGVGGGGGGGRGGNTLKQV